LSPAGAQIGSISEANASAVHAWRPPDACTRLTLIFLFYYRTAPFNHGKAISGNRCDLRFANVTFL